MKHAPLLFLLMTFFSSEMVFAQTTNGDFRRGDCLVDGHVDLADAVHLAELLFNNPAPFDCEDACDANDDGIHDVGDLISILSMVLDFLPLSTPGPNCGPDPTADLLPTSQTAFYTASKNETRSCYFLFVPFNCLSICHVSIALCRDLQSSPVIAKI